MHARSSAIRAAIVASIAARWVLTPVVARAQSASRPIVIADPAGRATFGASAADSIATLLKARVAQRKFEQVRRANLPITDAYPSSRCDVRVGRFCYWHDEDFVPPPEPERTAAERRKFLSRLADAGAEHPRDEWIAGQRVRYLVEDARASEAVQVAGACASTDSTRGDSTVYPSPRASIWCDALQGFALHANGEYARAERAFDRALGAMPVDERCRWTDVEPLIDGDRAKRYRALPCGARADFERRFYALARPTHVFDANDLRTEMLSRQVMARLEQAARGAHDMTWGDDTRELMLRYGWETKWSKRRPSIGDPTTVSVIGHEPTPGFDFVPNDAAFANPAHAPDDGWDPRNATAYTRYAPRWAKAFVGAPHQLAIFRRGDSAVVVAAIDVRRDTLFRTDSIAAALAIIADSSGDSAVVAHTFGSARLARLTATTRRAPMLVSVEAIDTATHHAAWSRHALTVPALGDSSALGVSDLLLLESDDSLPVALDDAARQARGTARVSGSRTLGAFWELYRLAAVDSTVRYTITVRPRDQGLVRSLARRIGLAKANEPVRMQWDEPLAAMPIIARALAIDLSTLPVGRYALELTAESGAARAVTRRDIEVVR